MGISSLEHVQDDFLSFSPKLSRARLRKILGPCLLWILAADFRRDVLPGSPKPVKGRMTLEASVGRLERHDCRDDAFSHQRRLEDTAQSVLELPLPHCSDIHKQKSDDIHFERWQAGMTPDDIMMLSSAPFGKCNGQPQKSYARQGVHESTKPQIWYLAARARQPFEDLLVPGSSYLPVKR